MQAQHLPSRTRVIAAGALAAMLATGAAQDGAGAVHAGRLAGITGPGQTGVQVQNLDPARTVTIIAEFYGESGKVHAAERPGIPPWGSTTFWLPGIPELAQAAYAMVIRSDPPVRLAAINRTDWRGGGAAIYSNPLPGRETALPLALKSFAHQTSLVAVQNTDVGQPNNVTAEFYRTGETAPLASLPLTIAPGAATTLDVGRSGAFAAVPAGSLGSMRFTAAISVTAMSFVDVENSLMGVSAFEAVPADLAGRRMFVPLFRSRFRGTTGISVVNPGAGAVDVKVSYFGSPLAPGCPSASIAHNGGQPARVGGRSSVVFYQGGPTAEAGPPGLPPDCFGSAVVEAQGPGAVLAVVNDVTLDASGVVQTAAAYNAVGEGQAGRLVSVPLWRNRHTAADLVTGIQAMNIGTAAAHAKITFLDSGGAGIPGGADRTPTIAPSGSYTWYPPNVSGVQDRTNVYGSAVIESDQPLAVIVSDVSLAGRSDACVYNAVRADPGSAVAGVEGRAGSREAPPGALRFTAGNQGMATAATRSPDPSSE